MKKEEFMIMYPANASISLAWGDMDAAQHINNAMYFRYFETGRIAYFEHINYAMDANLNNIGPILAETSCKYKAPLTFPDTILVGVSVDLESIDEYSFIMNQIVYSNKLQRIAATGTAKIVSYDYKTLQKAPLLPIFKEKIMAFESKK